MRRQRYPQTVSAQDEVTRNKQEDSASTFESNNSQSSQQQQQSDFIYWPQRNFDASSSNSRASSRLFQIEQQQQRGSTNAFHQYGSGSFNNFGCTGESFLHNFLPSFIDNLDYVSYSSGGDLPPDYCHQQQQSGGHESTEDYQNDSSDGQEVPATPTAYPALSPNGTVFLTLRNCIRIDINAEKSVFITNGPARCVGVVNGSGDKCCIIHPNGKILQDGTTIHMETGNKAAKICQRGIIFSSTNHSLAYLVDPSGTKSTSERFRELSGNVAANMFRSGIPHTPEAVNICCSMVSEASYRKYNNGDEAWIIGGIRIKLNMWGEVRITTHCGRRVLKTSPSIQSMLVSTPFFFADVSCSPFRYFIVRRGEKTVTCGNNGMLIQNGSQKAGFNRLGMLVLH